MIHPVDLPAEMPVLLKEFVSAYANSHTYLKTEKGAAGACASTSYDFISRLGSSPHIGEAVDWAFDSESWGHDVDDWGWVLFDGPEIPQFIEEVYTVKSASMLKYGAHTAVLVDDEWYIDFTARQFCKESPWPLIWRAACSTSV